MYNNIGKALVENAVVYKMMIVSALAPPPKKNSKGEARMQIKFLVLIE